MRRRVAAAGLQQVARYLPLPRVPGVWPPRPGQRPGRRLLSLSALALAALWVARRARSRRRY